MREDVAEITDNCGAWITVEVVPGDSDNPEFVQIAINDRPWSSGTSVLFTREQADALIKALTDAIG